MPKERRASPASLDQQVARKKKNKQQQQRQAVAARDEGAVTVTCKKKVTRTMKPLQATMAIGSGLHSTATITPKEAQHQQENVEPETSIDRLKNAVTYEEGSGKNGGEADGLELIKMMLYR